ncbi:hypothetical protein E8E13_011679 [Curvularia kusanoi]|uniref:Uncharacterized protein n=1 Tax=Curvularia kusanoi TaxID=90978 RepID=A0A9P4WF28_CURKU|nr:hypothetical protein E8E13_011679 [Curvularia kusanoi]
MASSGKADHQKSKLYAVNASKGFSYYLPKTAQGHLKMLLKQLPSAARSIYNEHYRDLMCGKACAATSAAAMADFVRAFPRCAKMHNAFASEMNAEIESNVHEGYEPVLFPIVDEPGPEGEDEEVEIQGRASRKRQQAPVDFSAPTKKAKTIHESSPRSSTQGNGKVMPLSTSNTSNWPSRESSPLSDVPSSEGDALSDDNLTGSEDSHALLTSDDIDQGIVSKLAGEDHITPDSPTDATAPPSPSIPLANPPKTPEAREGSPQPLDDSVGTELASPPDTVSLEDVTWEDGLAAIEAFDWS